MKLDRRHAFGLICHDAAIEFACIELKWSDDALVFVGSTQAHLGVEPQVGLTLVGVGTMARIAMVGEYRANVAIEFDGCGRCRVIRL